MASRFQRQIFGLKLITKSDYYDFEPSLTISCHSIDTKWSANMQCKLCVQYLCSNTGSKILYKIRYISDLYGL